MTSPQVSPPNQRKVLSARRIGLLASTVAGLGALALVGSAIVPSHNNVFASPAYAQSTNRPVGFADIVEKVKPSVISVRVKVPEATPQVSGLNGEDFNVPPGSPFEQFFKRFGRPDGQPGNPRRRNFSMGQGSGFFISADGYAVTNNHVVDKAESVEVTTDDGKTYSAKVIGTDSRTDLALIKVSGRDDFPAVHLAEHSPRIGDWVLAVGNPFGLGGTVTAGIVSARGRDIGAGPYDDFIQIDAPVNKGNSGGPTFDVDGNVIGVNTAIFSPSGGSVGIAFAIPAETVKTVVAQLKDKGSVTRGWIGVQIQPVTKDIADSMGLKIAEGALVAEPQSDSPAAKAGIKSGDVITQVNGDAIKDARVLARKVGSMTPGATAKVTIIRDGKEQTVNLTIGNMPNQREAKADTNSSDENSGPQLGLSLAPADRVDGLSGPGVAVTQVDPDGPAAEHGFKVGDVILEVNGAKVTNPGEVKQAITSARSGGKRTVLMRVKSGELTRFVAVPVGNA
ncbi:MAG: Do family serine endopeptidase [Xanthobacteraceae bacterium]